MNPDAVQLAGGTAEAEKAFVGSPRELRVDVDNGDLRLHDGETPGGKVFPNRDNLDTRYQAQSDELDGLKGFKPNQRGLLFRMGAGEYVIRELKVTVGQLKITNGNGQDGNPTLGLADEITTDHTVSGNWLFNKLLKGTAGFQGNLDGDTEGTHTGPVTGNVTGDVTGNLEGNSSGTHTGAIDARGFDVQFDDESIPAEAIADLGAIIGALAGIVVNGMIVMWSGNADNIPSGWHLCDGTNGTPNLSGKFIRGGTSSGAVGGTASHSHVSTASSAGAHTHDLTVDAHALTLAEMPNHAHGSGVCDQSVGGNWAFNHGSKAASPASSQNVSTNSGAGTLEALTDSQGDGAGHSHTATSASAGSHTHAIEVEESSHLPPYYTLCFIMRVGA